MRDRVDFLDLFGVDKSLLMSGNRSIVFTDEHNSDKDVMIKVFAKPDGTLVLQAGEEIEVSPSDYKIKIRSN